MVSSPDLQVLEHQFGPSGLLFLLALVAAGLFFLFGAGFFLLFDPSWSPACLPVLAEALAFRFRGDLFDLFHFRFRFGCRRSYRFFHHGDSHPATCFFGQREGACAGDGARLTALQVEDQQAWLRLFGRGLLGLACGLECIGVGLHDAEGIAIVVSESSGGASFDHILTLRLQVAHLEGRIALAGPQ